MSSPKGPLSHNLPMLGIDMKPFLIPNQLNASWAAVLVASISSKSIKQNESLNEFQMKNRAYLKYRLMLLMRFGSLERWKISFYLNIC